MRKAGLYFFGHSTKHHFINKSWILWICLAPPRIRSRPQKEMVRRGETVRLRCEAEGDEPIIISWLAKGISLNDTKDPRYVCSNYHFYFYLFYGDKLFPFPNTNTFSLQNHLELTLLQHFFLVFFSKDLQQFDILQVPLVVVLPLCLNLQLGK